MFVLLSQISDFAYLAATTRKKMSTRTAVGLTINSDARSIGLVVSSTMSHRAQQISSNLNNILFCTAVGPTTCNYRLQC